jgi:hypothetical protein
LPIIIFLSACQQGPITNENEQDIPGSIESSLDQQQQLAELTATPDPDLDVVAGIEANSSPEATAEESAEPTINATVAALPSISEDLESNEFGITEFLREQVSEGKGIWPFMSLDDPDFVAADGATHVHPKDLVLGVSLNGENKAYPISMMWFHHVANDVIGGDPVAITY